MLGDSMESPSLQHDALAQGTAVPHARRAHLEHLSYQKPSQGDLQLLLKIKLFLKE